MSARPPHPVALPTLAAAVAVALACGALPARLHAQHDGGNPDGTGSGRPRSVCVEPPAQAEAPARMLAEAKAPAPPARIDSIDFGDQKDPKVWQQLKDLGVPEHLVDRFKRALGIFNDDLDEIQKTPFKCRKEFLAGELRASLAFLKVTYWDVLREIRKLPREKRTEADKVIAEFERKFSRVTAELEKRPDLLPPRPP